MDFVPFDPTSKRTLAYVQTSSGEKFRVAKGAPQIVFLNHITFDTRYLNLNLDFGPCH